MIVVMSKCHVLNRSLSHTKTLSCIMYLPSVNFERSSKDTTLTPKPPHSGFNMYRLFGSIGLMLFGLPRIVLAQPFYSDFKKLMMKNHPPRIHHVAFLPSHRPIPHPKDPSMVAHWKSHKRSRPLRSTSSSVAFMSLWRIPILRMSDKILSSCSLVSAGWLLRVRRSPQ